MDNLCRICRKDYNAYFYTLTSTHDGIEISELVNKTCPIQISPDDPVNQFLPKSICSDCLEIVSASFNLQRICIESDQYFRSLIINEQVLIKSEKFDTFLDIKEEKVEVPADPINIYQDFYVNENEMDVYLEPEAKKRKKNVKSTAAVKNIRKECKSSKRAYFFCDLCERSCYTKREIQYHMNVDHLKIKLKSPASKKPLTCDDCLMTFRSKVAKTKHIKLVYSKEFRELENHEIVISYKCCKCEQNHHTEADLTNHLELHIESFKSEKTKCSFCPKNVSNFEEFVEHSNYHSMPQTHECLTCKRLFPFDDKLLKHVKNHKRMRIENVLCTKCNQKFKSSKYLEIHDKVKHSMEMMFVCQTCGKSLSTASALDQHIRFVHNKEKESKFECKYCHLKFVLKSRLAKHEAVHSTVRPHVCEICGSSFKQACKLNKHKKIHDGTVVKKHKCPQCSFCFAARDKLKQHMLTHTGEKPHECKYCDRAYASKGDLIKHMQKLHVGDNVYQCQKCPRAFRLIVELREHQKEHVKL